MSMTVRGFMYGGRGISTIAEVLGKRGKQTLVTLRIKLHMKDPKKNTKGAKRSKRSRKDDAGDHDADYVPWLLIPLIHSEVKKAGHTHVLVMCDQSKDVTAPGDDWHAHMSAMVYKGNPVLVPVTCGDSNVEVPCGYPVDAKIVDAWKLMDQMDEDILDKLQMDTTDLGIAISNAASDEGSTIAMGLIEGSLTAAVDLDEDDEDDEDGLVVHRAEEKEELSEDDDFGEIEDVADLDDDASDVSVDENDHEIDGDSEEDASDFEGSGEEPAYDDEDSSDDF